MNVTCTGCPAKYAVPDEKVRGKKVRITCKHCGTNIVVDGTVADASAEASPKPAAQPAAASAAKAGAESKPAQVKSAGAATEPMFIVGFADDRQETHTIARIVELYSTGKIDDETLVWKDGMADWLSPFDVPELAAAIRAKNVAPRPQAPTVPAFVPTEEDDATLVVKSPLDDPEVAAAIAASAPSVAPAAAAPQPAIEAPKPIQEEPTFAMPAAARRLEKRGGSVDLFGKVAEAGSEGDVSLDLGSSDERGQKLTGARNESSVLFSLDALTKAEAKATPSKSKEREREASEALFGESAPNSLMNLGGSGLNAMSAPDFTKPVVPGAKVVPLHESSDEPSVPSKGRGGMILLVAFLAIAAAAGVAFVMMKKQQLTAEPTATPPSATAAATTSAEPVAPEAPGASAVPAASAAPTPSVSAAAGVGSAAAIASTSPASASAAAPASARPATSTAATPAAAVAAATPATPAAAAKPADPAAAAAKPPEAPAATEGAAFDKNAAVAALSAAAASAGSCKTADGPTGAGKVSVTFAPSGRATATSVAGDLAGTEVGGCVARLFRAAKVPPFTGDPVTVSKSFTVQ